MSQSVVQCYGITQDPETKNYGIVMEYAEFGCLHTFLCNHKITMNVVLNFLCHISDGLNTIHKSGFVHRDFHSGNILLFKKPMSYFFQKNFQDIIPKIADLGLSVPVDNSLYRKSLNSSEIYGVIPYVAPEILRFQPYTTAADVYSFGMILWEIISRKRPFSSRQHDAHLIIDICNGIRPAVQTGTPNCYVDLMKKCWSNDPNQRPTMENVVDVLMRWNHVDIKDNESSIYKEFIESEKIRENDANLDQNIQDENVGAIYASSALSQYITRAFEIDTTNF